MNNTFHPPRPTVNQFLIKISKMICTLTTKYYSFRFAKILITLTHVSSEKKKPRVNLPTYWKVIIKKPLNLGLVVELKWSLSLTLFKQLSKVVDVKRLTMLSNTFLVAVLASMMVVAWALPFHQTVLSQDVAEKGSLIEGGLFYHHKSHY